MVVEVSSLWRLTATLCHMPPGGAHTHALGPSDSWPTATKAHDARGSKASSQNQPARRPGGYWFPLTLTTSEEIDLSASVTIKLAFESLQIMPSMTAILDVNQVSITDMSGKRS